MSFYVVFAMGLTKNFDENAYRKLGEYTVRFEFQLFHSGIYALYLAYGRCLISSNIPGNSTLSSRLKRITAFNVNQVICFFPYLAKIKLTNAVEKISSHESRSLHLL